MSSYDESMEDFIQLDDSGSGSDFEASPPPKKVRTGLQNARSDRSLTC